LSKKVSDQEDTKPKKFSTHWRHRFFQVIRERGTKRLFVLDWQNRDLGQNVPQFPTLSPMEKSLWTVGLGTITICKSVFISRPMNLEQT
jgi:hypothetical protein